MRVPTAATVVESVDVLFVLLMIIAHKNRVGESIFYLSLILRITFQSTNYENTPFQINRKFHLRKLKIFIQKKKKKQKKKTTKKLISFIILLKT